MLSFVLKLTICYLWIPFVSGPSNAPDVVLRSFSKPITERTWYVHEAPDRSFVLISGIYQPFIPSEEQMKHLDAMKQLVGAQSWSLEPREHWKRKGSNMFLLSFKHRGSSPQRRWIICRFKMIHKLGGDHTLKQDTLFDTGKPSMTFPEFGCIIHHETVQEMHEIYSAREELKDTLLRAESRKSRGFGDH